MNTEDFSVICHVCSGEVNYFTQSIKFLLMENSAVQEAEIISLSCGCVVDFPDWRIDVTTGKCAIVNYAEIMYIEFYDEELISGDDEF